MNSIRIDTGQIKRDIQKYFIENDIDCSIDNWQFEYDEDNNLLYHPKAMIEVEKGLREAQIFGKTPDKDKLNRFLLKYREIAEEYKKQNKK